MKKNVIFLDNGVEYDSSLSRKSFPSFAPFHLFRADKHTIFEKYKRSTPYNAVQNITRNGAPATSAVIVTSSNTILTNTLEHMKNSIWWNHEASYLILNQNFDQGCHEAQLFLSTIWTFSILSATYICHNFNNELMLYTFNPFASLAPEFWNKVVRDDKFPNKYWTLFQHSFDSIQSFEILFAYSKYKLANFFKVKKFNGPFKDIHCMF